MRYFKIGLIIVVILLNIALIVTGCTNNPDFWKLTLSGILSLDMTAMVSVFVVQMLTSKRRKYDFLVKKLDEIVINISEEYLFERTKKATLLQKSIANQLEYISKACPYDTKKDIDYITEKFKELQDYYGDHSDAEPNDTYYEREKINVKDKILKLQLKLYGFNV